MRVLLLLLSACSVSAYAPVCGAGDPTCDPGGCVEGDEDGDGVCNDDDVCAEGDDADDADDDGLADACDGCPDLAGDDPDGDGLCGEDDPCPEVEGATCTEKVIVALQAENAQLKEETAFFEKLLGSATAGKNGLAVQRLQAERETADSYRFRALVVQGSAEAAFKGRLSMTATLITDNNKRVTLNLPEEQADLVPSLGLDFKTYQRVEGLIKVPANAQLKTLLVRVVPAGSATPKAQQSLQL